MLTRSWWIDAQVSPALAMWLNQDFPDLLTAVSVRQLGLRSASDVAIFEAARQHNAIVVTKDIDFVHLNHKHGPPPQILWLTCGNTSTAVLRSLLARQLPAIMALFAAGEPLVEFSGR